MNIFEVLERLGKSKGRDYSRAKLKANYDQHVRIWQNYYNGEVPGINQDTYFNGETFTQFRRQSMKVAKQIASKWACLLFTEQFSVTLKDEAETEKFRALEKQIDFRAKLNKGAIFGYAEGTAALLASANVDKESIYGSTIGGKVKLDLIRYDSIYPLEFDKDDITTVAFIKREQKEGLSIYTISIHSLENKKAVIENFIATVEGDNVDFTGAEKVVQEQTFNNQMYCVIKPNTANDFTDVLPFGASIFADALAPCGDIDLAADLLRNDVKEGNQKTFIGRDLLLEKIGDDGKKRQFFENNRTFYTVPQTLAQGSNSPIKQLFECVVPEIRTERIWKVVHDSLDWACAASGLGKGTLDIMPMQTATMVVHSEAEKMQNKSLHEQFLEGEIAKLVKALCELSSAIGNPIDASEVNIVWQDSVIVDTGEEKKLSLVEIDAGVFSKVEYRQKYFGESKEEAEAKIAEMGGSLESAYSGTQELPEGDNSPNEGADAIEGTAGRG